MATQSQTSSTTVTPQQAIPRSVWKILWIAVFACFTIGGILYLWGSLSSLSVSVANSETKKRIERITVVLKGENVLSEPISTPKGVQVYYSGPPSAKVHFGDGTSGSIAEWHGEKPGPIRFAGPKGQAVFADIVYR